MKGQILVFGKDLYIPILAHASRLGHLLKHI